MRFYDAHNHLQDDRFGGRQSELVAACAAAGIVRMVVNGSCEEDWPKVLDLARTHPMVLPSFGYHPWYVHERSADWVGNLQRLLDAVPSAVGEIGLDRWERGLGYAPQEEVFCSQLRIAAERGLAVSIHCLQAWGRLLELLRTGPVPPRGFLLHSFGGPREMVPALAKLGAYFGFPGYFLHERKTRQRETFRHIPPDRLLVETDAPDQPLPESLASPVPGGKGRGRWDAGRGKGPGSQKPVNHPANLAAVYRGLATLLELPLADLAGTVEQNFARLFGTQ